MIETWGPDKNLPDETKILCHQEEYHSKSKHANFQQDPKSMPYSYNLLLSNKPSGTNAIMLV